MTWKIQGITTELTGQSIAIDRDMLVGRHQDADVLLQLAEISRRHAAFLLKDQVLWLQDLNSSNGTFVNDVRIAEETQLKDGDTVQFATLKFAVLQEQALATPAVADVDVVEVPAVKAAITQPAEAVATSQHLNLAQDTQDSTVTLAPSDAQPAAVIEAPVVTQLEVEPATTSEPATESVKKSATEPTPAAVLSEQGMPEVAERAAGTPMSKEGMPEHVAIPKPAPIPEHVDIHAKASHAKTTAETVEPVKSVTVATPADETKKNASVGLMTLVSLVVLAILAWLFFK